MCAAMNPPEDPGFIAVVAAPGGANIPILVQISDSKKIKIPFRTTATVDQLAQEARRRAAAMGCVVPATAHLVTASDGAILWGEDILADVIDLPMPLLRFQVPVDDDDMHIDVDPHKVLPVVPAGGAAAVAGVGVSPLPSFCKAFGGVVLSEDGYTAICDKHAEAGAAILNFTAEAGKAYYFEVETVVWPDDGGTKKPTESEGHRHFGRMAWICDEKDALIPGSTISSYGFNNYITAYHNGHDITHGASGVSYSRDEHTVAIVGCAVDARAQSARIGWTVGGVAVGPLTWGDELPPLILASLPLRAALTLLPGIEHAGIPCPYAVYTTHTANLCRLQCKSHSSM
jgi:hypothetical protein